MNRSQDPQKYNMYAAFRTKERGEKKAREKRDSIYDLNRPKQRTQQAGQTRPAANSPDGIYRISRSSRPTYGTQDAARPPQRSAQNVPTRERGMYGAQSTARQMQSPAPRPMSPQGQVRSAEQGRGAIDPRRAGVYGDAAQNAARTSRNASSDRDALAPVNTNGSSAQASLAARTEQAKSQAHEKAKTALSTRVQNKGEDAYRYGFHSSYRTSDGRILDGFDKTGKPIYRESGGSAVVRHVGSDVDVSKLHPVRRIRVETLVDTKKKPFPFMLVLTMIFCTAMVMGVLYSYMRLNECTNTLSTLNYRLSQLRGETNTLTAEVVRREDLIAIEQTAADVLGMVKNDVLTKRYVSIENEDKTEIFDDNVEVKDEHDIVQIDMKTGDILIPKEPEASENGTSAP